MRKTQQRRPGGAVRQTTGFIGSHADGVLPHDGLLGSGPPATSDTHVVPAGPPFRTVPDRVFRRIREPALEAAELAPSWARGTIRRVNDPVMVTGTVRHRLSPCGAAPSPARSLFVLSSHRFSIEAVPHRPPRRSAPLPLRSSFPTYEPPDRASRNGLSYDVSRVILDTTSVIDTLNERLGIDIPPAIAESRPCRYSRQ